MKHLKILGLMAMAAMAVMAFGAASASATTLAIGGVKQTGSVAIESSLKAGTSAILKDEFGTTTDTCTTSNVSGSTTTTTGATVSGPVSALSFSNCTHTTTVLSKGSLSVAVSGTGPNGTVSSSGAEVTVFSTFFGASATCKTGTGTTIGTLTGTTSTASHATIDINAKINCGILGSSSWTGTYTVTSPTGLSVTS